MKNQRIIISLVAIMSLFISIGARAATSTDEYAEAKQFINQNVSCQSLTQDQLEKIGDYYMEQMMPGQAHKNMEQVLGGEGSESLRQAHIFMARRWYCGDATGYGMMGMMNGTAYGYGQGQGYTNNIANRSYPGGMMGGWTNPSWNSGYGMMGFGPGYYGGYGWFGALMMIGFGVLVIFGILAALKYLRNK